MRLRLFNFTPSEKDLCRPHRPVIKSGFLLTSPSVSTVIPRVSILTSPVCLVPSDEQHRLFDGGLPFAVNFIKGEFEHGFWGNSMAQKSFSYFIIRFHSRVVATSLSLSIVATPLSTWSESSNLPVRPVARILRVWNQAVTPKEVFQQIKPYVSLEWQQWFFASHRQVRSLQTSVDFVGNDQFFLRSPGTMVLVNTSEIHEGRLMIHRRPFTFNKDESLQDIALRLQNTRFNRQFQFQSWIQFLWQKLLPSLEAAADQSTLIAPLLALIDNERSQSRCESHLAEMSSAPTPKKVNSPMKRQIASLGNSTHIKQNNQGLTEECRSLVATILQQKPGRQGRASAPTNAVSQAKQSVSSGRE